MDTSRADRAATRSPGISARALNSFFLTFASDTLDEISLQGGSDETLLVLRLQDVRFLESVLSSVDPGVFAASEAAANTADKPADGVEQVVSSSSSDLQSRRSRSGQGGQAAIEIEPRDPDAEPTAQKPDQGGAGDLISNSTEQLVQSPSLRDDSALERVVQLVELMANRFLHSDWLLTRSRLVKSRLSGIGKLRSLDLETAEQIGELVVLYSVNCDNRQGAIQRIVQDMEGETQLEIREAILKAQADETGHSTESRASVLESFTTTQTRASLAISAIIPHHGSDVVATTSASDSAGFRQVPSESATQAFLLKQRAPETEIGYIKGGTAETGRAYDEESTPAPGAGNVDLPGLETISRGRGGANRPSSPAPKTLHPAAAPLLADSSPTCDFLSGIGGEEQQPEPTIWRKRFEQLQVEYIQLESQREELQAAYRALEGKNKALQQLNDRLEAASTAQGPKRQMMKDVAKQYEEEINSLKALISDMTRESKETGKAAQSERQRLQDEIHMLSKELEEATKYKMAAEKQKAKLQASVSEVVVLREENARLTADREELKQIVSDFQSSAGADTDIVTLKNRIQLLTLHNDKLKNSVDQLLDSKQTLARELEESKLQKLQLTQKVQQQIQEVPHEFSEANAALLAKIEALEARKETLEIRLQQSERQLEAQEEDLRRAVEARQEQMTEFLKEQIKRREKELSALRIHESEQAMVHRRHQSMLAGAFHELVVQMLHWRTEAEAAREEVKAVRQLATSSTSVSSPHHGLDSSSARVSNQLRTD